MKTRLSHLRWCIFALLLTLSSAMAAQNSNGKQQNAVGDWGGTGFALNDGYVATNYHVVDGAASIKISGVQGNFNTSYSANVVASDKFNDLAILKINDPAFKGFGTIPYRVKTTLDEAGEEIFVLGYPLTATMGEEIKLTTGVISAKTGFRGDVSLYQISAPVQPGNSGGPLFDSKGDLIGIVNAKHTGAENVGYAIKTSYLQNLMETSLSSNIFPTSNTVSALSLSEKVKRLKNFTFMIKCSSQASISPPKSSNNKTSSTSSGSTLSASPSKSGTSGKHVRTINNPSVSQNYNAQAIKINSVVLNTSYTAVQFTYKNLYATDGCCNIDKDTYILIGGQRYTMTRAKGIEVAPQKTNFSREGEELTFTLYFPAIPSNTTTMDLIENPTSSWRFYEININSPTDGSIVSEPTGYINGYGYVDLGLSVKWTTCNVGADTPIDYGNFYAWGETETKSTYVEENSVTYRSRKKKIIKNGISGNPKYDVARAKMGSTWRMPTLREANDLMFECKWEHLILNGIKGFKVTGPNGNSIFIPSSGYYYSINMRRGETCCYWTGDCYNNSESAHEIHSRDDYSWVNKKYYGLPIRPVSE